ncbi:hypothetical protein AVR91_0223770 [Amycolatopsis keratiniphila subsp. keratiniphila]|uniref:Uncharacterized protein n=1 Tax=Amycolatopsis keratiniphila subsp. keratiniphila TaxID=227715 RepID=A0A1W2LRQ1_9PSEU|nr:hypothetical protein AVR91_0223770 [Amycolatopsis keratiniphila subsp. keratiniphila]
MLLAATTTVILTVTACGSDDSGAAGQGTEQGAAGQGNRGGGPGDGRGVPGATGKIAAISGAMMQVQNAQNGQVSVTYTDTTTFTQQVTATLADLKVEDCVRVTAEAPVNDSGDSVTAATVSISKPVDGACGTRGSGRGTPSGGMAPPSRERPSMPSGAPSAPGGRDRGQLGGTFGKVTAVTANGFTVESTVPGSQDTRTVAATVSAGTTWKTNAAATAAALEVGRCVTATGKPDDTGAVTATDITITDPVDGECAGMFGRGGGS